MKKGSNAILLAREFEIVKINVGQFDRNLDVAAAYGNPINQGIPAAVITLESMAKARHGPLHH